MKKDKSCYQQDYKLRYNQRNTTGSIEVTFPHQVVKKEARKQGMTVDQYIKKFKVVAHYNGFEGVLYTFVKIEND